MPPADPFEERPRGRWSRRLQTLALIAVGAAFVGAAVRQWRASRGGASAGPGVTVLRVAHSVNDPEVERAFAAIAAAYSRLHPNVVIKIQAVPLQVYRQWARTQLIGGTPPDLIQPLSPGGVWEQLATEYLVPLSADVEAPNPYNRGTSLAGVPWRETYTDGMQNGYFLHLMEFYAAPFCIQTPRLCYNRDLLRRITGSDRPPHTYREWLELGARVKAWAAAHHQELAALAVDRQDIVGGSSGASGLFVRYFDSLTGGMMERYDMQSWGAPNSTLTLWGLMNGSFSLKSPRLRAACAAVRQIADLCQTGFSSALPDDKRFLFLQQKAVMVVGDTRDYGVYRHQHRFSVGVCDFPSITKKDPVYGKYYTGRFWEGRGSMPLALAITRASRHRTVALDFLRFATSLRENAAFCSRLSWYPVIRGAAVTAQLAVFRPHTLGSANSPALVYPDSSTQVYFDQNLPLYLSHQLSFDALMDGLTREWLEHGWGDVNRTLNLRFRAEKQTEFNVTEAKARMLFREAGNPADVIIRDHRTRYQLGLEIIQLLDANIMRRKYIHANLPLGRYRYPPPVAPAMEKKD